VNRIVQGSALSRLLRSPFFGYVGHLVSQVPTKDLTGPVLGKKIAAALRSIPSQTPFLPLAVQTSPNRPNIP